MKKISFLFALSMISGCAHWWNTAPLPEGAVSYVGASKRTVQRTAVTPVSLGVYLPSNITCSEPSPDIAKATQQALAAALSVPEKGELSFSSSKAEAIAALVERTASIQLLRDYMYRACEGVANGMMTTTSYSLLMSRTNKAMITLMLGETAGGAFGRSGAVIGGKSSANSSLVMQGLVSDFDDAIEKLTNIDLALAEANKELTTAKEAVAAHEAQENPDADVSKTLADAVTEKESVVNKLTFDKANAVQQVQTAQNKTMESAAEIVQAQGVGSITANTSHEVASILGDMQERYITDSLADDFVSACIIDMGMRRWKVDENTQDVKIIPSSVRTGFLERLNGKPESIPVYVGDSVLSGYCENELANIISWDSKNRQSQLNKQLEIEDKKYLRGILVQCNSLEDKKSKESCLTLAGIEIPKPSPTPPKDTTPKKNILDVAELNKLESHIKVIAQSLTQLDLYVAKLEALDLSKKTEVERDTRDVTVKNAKMLKTRVTETLDGKHNTMPGVSAQKMVQNYNDYLLETTKLLQQKPTDAQKKEAENQFDLLQLLMSDANKKLASVNVKLQEIFKKLKMLESKYSSSNDSKAIKNIEKIAVKLEGTMDAYRTKD